MLDARESFLERGWYDGLRSALIELVSTERAHRVIDIGCGTGFYLRGVLSAFSHTASEDGAGVVQALAMDLSPAAVARTVRAGHADPTSQTVGLVADVWSPLPIRDAAADLLINVFAPRNPLEFHRILAPGGMLAVVVPAPAHLLELRAAGLALDVHANKIEDLVSALSASFALESSRELTQVLQLDAPDVAALIGMGPSAHHHRSDPEKNPGTGKTTDVTVAFQLLAFRRLPA